MTSPPSESSLPAEPVGAETGDPSVDAALDAGDLTGALELARQARHDAPSAATWATEGAVHEARGEWVAAMSAYGEAKNRSSDPAQGRAYEAKIAELEPRARGVVADEPDSTHREALDAERAARDAPEPTEAPAPEPAPEPEDRKPIVKQWYFWVTVVAVAASAGAITGIAVKSAIDDRKETRSGAAFGPSPAGGPVLLRF